MQRLISSLLIICTFPLLSTLIYAQSVNDEIELGRIVITPSRMSQYEHETTSNVTVIDKSRIEESNARFVADILKEEVGINIYDAGSSKTTKVDIRGFADTSASNVLLLLNGRKVTPIDISGSDWTQIPLEAVDRIEIIKGAGSVLYGDNAVGGVVNIITKKGKGAMSVEFDSRLGSFRAYQEDLEISGKSDKLSYYLFAKYTDTDGYRTNSDMLTKDYNARVNSVLSENFSLDLITGWHEDDYGMPGGLNDQGELSEHGRRGSTNKKDYAETKDRYVQLLFDTKPVFGNMNLGNLTLDLSYRNRDDYSWFDYDAWGATATKYMIDTYSANTKLVHNGYLFDRGLNIVTGVDYYDVENKIKGSGSGISASSDDLIVYKKELGFYFYSEYEPLSSLFINSGVRYQKAKYRFNQRQASLRYETKNPSETVFMAGLKYEYAEKSNLHLSIQETFRFLASDEWFNTWTGLNTNLNQQSGIQYELGVKHNFFDTFNLSLTTYWIDLKNEIYLNPVPSPGINENYDRTERRGVELGWDIDLMKFFNFTFLDKLNLYTNYTYQTPEFSSGDYGGSDIPMVPRHKASFGLRANIFKNYSLSLDANYIGERYAINDTNNETPRVDDYFVFDSKFSYRNDFLEIYLVINNILNEKYSAYVIKSTSSNTKDYFPSPERNYLVGCSLKF